MTKIISLCSLLLLLFIFTIDCTAQKKGKKKKNQDKVELKTNKDTISYIIGVDIGHNFKKSSIDVDPDILLKGLNDAMQDIDTTFTEAERTKIITDFQKELQTKQQEEMSQEAETNKKRDADFLLENKKKEGVVELPSGLQYKVISEGVGKLPEATDKVTVHYHGTLIDGTVFDSSYDRGEPASFPLNGVIKGWTEGLQLMKTGAVYEFYIPSDLAYGDRSMGGSIYPGATLIFKVELISID